MEFQTPMAIKAVLCLVSGVPAVLIPDFVHSIFGLALDPTGVSGA